MTANSMTVARVGSLNWKREKKLHEDGTGGEGLWLRTRNTRIWRSRRATKKKNYTRKSRTLVISNVRLGVIVVARNHDDLAHVLYNQLENGDILYGNRYSRESVRGDTGATTGRLHQHGPEKRCRPDDAWWTFGVNWRGCWARWDGRRGGARPVCCSSGWTTRARARCWTAWSRTGTNCRAKWSDPPSGIPSTSSCVSSTQFVRPWIVRTVDHPRTGLLERFSKIGRATAISAEFHRTSRDVNSLSADTKRSLAAAPVKTTTKLLVRGIV